LEVLLNENLKKYYLLLIAFSVSRKAFAHALEYARAYFRIFAISKYFSIYFGTLLKENKKDVLW